jgi:hypothetical protein
MAQLYGEPPQHTRGEANGGDAATIEGPLTAGQGFSKSASFALLDDTADEHGRGAA